MRSKRADWTPSIPILQKFCLDQQAIHSQGNKRMLEAIRSNSSTGGYAVHALTGGDWVLGAGLLDLVP